MLTLVATILLPIFAIVFVLLVSFSKHASLLTKNKSRLTLLGRNPAVSENKFFALGLQAIKGNLRIRIALQDCNVSLLRMGTKGSTEVP